MLLLLACAADDFVALEPPRDGAQLHIEAFTVEAFAEVERCYWMDAGNAEGFVTAMELHARPGLHHAVVYNSEQPGSGVEDCFGLPEAAMEDWHDVPQPLFASSTQVNEQVVDFPEGVGVQLAENAGVLVNVHYLNATSEPLQAEVYVNLVIEDAGQRRAVDFRKISQLDWQDWEKTATVQGVYVDTELVDERQPDATLMAVASILLSKEQDVLDANAPWGRGLAVQWSWAKVKKENPQITDLVIDYFATMHLVVEMAQSEDGICE